MTVALHEFSHAAAGCCTGAKIESVQIDPDEGGATRMVIKCIEALVFLGFICADLY